MGSEAHGPVRSALFVPANRRAWIEKAPKYGADALVLDLEDATPPAEKEEARQVLRETIAGLSEQRQTVWVRVNDLETEHIRADLDAACRAGVSLVCLPKVSGASDVAEADRLIAYAEGANGLPMGTIGIYPLLETAAGLLHAESVFRASPRVRYGGAIAAPGADVEFAVGYRWSDSFLETLAFRSQVLLAARASGILHPVTGLVTEVDEQVTHRFAEQSRAIGYEGMFVIHPSQIAVANTAFAPTDDEFAWSQEVLEVYEQAEQDGRGTALDSSGRLVDFAMLRMAKRVSARYRFFRERDGRSIDV
jgi:citrate lyase subunit beta/citryl-CoA lyase